MVIGAKHKSLDLVADSPDMCNVWVRGLKHMLKKMAEADLHIQQDVYPCLVSFYV